MKTLQEHFVVDMDEGIKKLEDQRKDKDGIGGYGTLVVVVVLLMFWGVVFGGAVGVTPGMAKVIAAIGGSGLVLAFIVWFIITLNKIARK